ncbi:MULTISPECIES: hypothetical protein [Microcoleaceae]|nr:hypothetical protein [Tychonema sp. LEGE 06208]
MRRVSDSLPILRDGSDLQNLDRERQFSVTSGDRPQSTKPI